MDHELIPEPLPEWLRKAPRYCGDPPEAARALRELIDSHADEAERLAYLPEPVVRGIAEAGLYGMLIPRELGGAEPHPTQILDAVMELSYADGSTGWCVMANVFFTGTLYAIGGDSLIQAVFETDGGYIGAGQISALGRADRVEGGLSRLRVLSFRQWQPRGELVPGRGDRAPGR